jgi:serine/threonine protein kinase
VPRKEQRGEVYGTPAYIAMKQAFGDVDSIDERTDVFGLGGLLYEMLTQRPPRRGPRREPPPWVTLANRVVRRRGDSVNASIVYASCPRTLHGFIAAAVGAGRRRCANGSCDKCKRARLWTVRAACSRVRNWDERSRCVAVERR